jgi:hypothetical protein
MQTITLIVVLIANLTGLAEQGMHPVYRIDDQITMITNEVKLWK